MNKYNCPHCEQGLNNRTLGDMTLVRILVTGWRFWPRERAHEVGDRIERMWHDLFPLARIVVVDGACEYGGADLYAHEWAVAQNSDQVLSERHPAIRIGGRLLGPQRNSHMVDLGFHAALSFPESRSRKTGGTWDCTRKIQAVSSMFHIHPYSWK